jgi:hypothetical protein
VRWCGVTRSGREKGVSGAKRRTPAVVLGGGMLDLISDVKFPINLNLNYIQYNIIITVLYINI